jgi:hypothetical protein
VTVLQRVVLFMRDFCSTVALSRVRTVAGLSLSHPLQQAQARTPRSDQVLPAHADNGCILVKCASLLPSKLDCLLGHLLLYKHV